MHSKKRNVRKMVCLTTMILGLVICLPCFYLAITSFGIVQEIGSLFGGDLSQADGFVWGKGGMEGLVYEFAAIEALGMIVGTILTLAGSVGMFLVRDKKSTM